MSYTIKAIINTGNLYLRYTYNRKKAHIKIAKLQEENLKDFISKKGIFKTNSDLNSLIRIETDYLERFVNKATDKTHTYVKENFKDYREKVKQLTRVKPKIEYIFKLQAEDEYKELLATEKRLKKELKEVQQQIFKYNAGGHKSEEELSFLNLLDVYQNREALKVKKNRTPSQIKTWIKTLKEFSEATNTPLSFENMTDEFYYKYGNYLMYDSKHKYFNATFSAHVKKLKTFLNYCIKNQGVKMRQNYKSWKLYDTEKEMVLLTKDEIELLYNYKEQLTESEKKIVDITYFQSYTGLRISDVFNSAWEMNTLKEKNTLKGVCKKSKNTFYTKLDFDSTGRARQILEHYNYNMKLCSEKHYNETIKKILKKCFEHHKINKEDIVIERFKFEESFKRKKSWFDLFSSHANRKFYINYLISKGVNETHILEYIGSKSVSELRSSYISTNEEDLDKTASRVMLNN